jgi:hypothetical protein
MSGRGVHQEAHTDLFHARQRRIRVLDIGDTRIRMSRRTGWI